MFVAHIAKQLQPGVGKCISALCVYHRDFSPIVIAKEASPFDIWIKEANAPFFIEKNDGEFIKRAQKADIINLHCYDEDLSLYKILLSTRKPIVITLHFAVVLTRVSSLIISPSRWVKSMQRSSNKCVYIQNAIDLKRYRPVKKFKFRRRRDKFVITRICRMEKCDEFFWPAMLDILDERKNTELWIIGEYGLSTRRIKMLGFCKDIYKVLSKVDIVVHTPLPGSGSMDIVPMEVMAMGIPSIFSSVDCVKASIKNRRQALFVDPGDSRMLKNKLLRLIDDSDFRYRIAEKGFRAAIRKFDAARMTRKYELTYQRIMRKQH